jgi:hypothetical protein
MMSIQWATTLDWTPVFNNPHLDRLPPDDQGLCRGLETVLFPGTVVKRIENIAPVAMQIETEEYPYEGSFYVNVHFLKPSEEQPSTRLRILPPLEVFLSRLDQLKGVRYTWGGCCPEGGLDCSGLIRYATDGITPHKTSALIRFGTAVAIENLPWEKQLKSGDLIVWVGHVVAVLDAQRAIESTPKQGVVTTPLKERMEHILQERRPLNEWPSSRPEQPSFVVRRFIPD